LNIRNAEVNYEKPSCYETFVHVISAPWKVLAATLPPKQVLGGWMRFFLATAMICGLTFVVMMFLATAGCLFNINPVMQGFILVALGSALPKTISAVRSADSSEDAANSVFIPIVSANLASVLIGLGLPWTVSGIWRYSQNSSALMLGQVETGHIALAAASLFIVSCIAYLILGFRRWVEGAEIGGHKALRIATGVTLVTMWACFVGINATNEYREWNMFQPAYLDEGIGAT
jgi:Ca2+/Na+ antiporter